MATATSFDRRVNGNHGAGARVDFLRGLVRSLSMNAPTIDASRGGRWANVRSSGPL